MVNAERWKRILKAQVPIIEPKVGLADDDKTELAGIEAGPVREESSQICKINAC